MRFVFVFFVICCSILSLKAQDQNAFIFRLEQNNADTLRKIIKECRAAYKETGKIEILQNQKLAESFLFMVEGNNQEPERIEALAWVIHSNPHLHNRQTTWAKFHMAGVLAHFHLNSLAKEYVDKMLYDAALTRNTLFLYRGNKLKGAIHLDEGENAQALKHYKKALDYCNTSDPAAYASDLNNVALAFQVNGDFENAHEYFSKGMTVALKNDTPAANAMYYLICGNMGSLLVEMGEYEKGERYALEEISYYERNNLKDETRGFAYYSAAAFYQKMGKTAQAREYAVKALNFAKGMNDNLNGQLKLLNHLNKLVSKSPVPLIDKLQLLSFTNEVHQKLLGQNNKTQRAINETIYLEKIEHLQKEEALEKKVLSQELKSSRFRLASYIVISVLLILALLTFVIIMRQRAEQTRQRLIIHEQNEVLAHKQQEILEYENRQQRESLNTLFTTLRIKQETENGFLQRIKDLKRRKDLNYDQLFNELQMSVHNLMAIDRKVITDSAVQPNQLFTGRIRSLHPDLTETELLYCQYFLSGLSAKEIGLLHNQTDGTVRVFKNKMKNKMGVPKEKDLDDYLKEIANH